MKTSGNAVCAVAVTAAGNRAKKNKAFFMLDITILPIDYSGYG